MSLRCSPGTGRPPEPMNPELARILANPAIWRGGDCAAEPASIASGFAALDAVLPGRRLAARRVDGNAARA